MLNLMEKMKVSIVWKMMNFFIIFMCLNMGIFIKKIVDKVQSKSSKKNWKQ